MTANGKKLFAASLEVTANRLHELVDGLIAGSSLVAPDATNEERYEVAKGFASACELAASAARHARSTGGLSPTALDELVQAEVDTILARN